MADALYIRLRGRVLGPFDEEKLRALARRGQLGRLHQLSGDGVNWAPASSYPDLFVSSDGQANAAGQATAPAALEAAASPPWGAKPADPRGASVASTSPPDDKAWHYELDGQEKGPVSRSVLMDLIASGRLKPTNQVWAEGMPSWAMASQVPDFIHLFAAHQSHAGKDTSSAAAELPADLCRVAVESRQWVMTIAIIVLIYSLTLLGLGFVLLILGANQHVPPVVIAGVNNLVSSVVVGVAGYMLLVYAGRLGPLRYNKAPVVLEKALQSLRVFWLYVAIVMLVVTALTLLVVVWIVAVAGSLPPNLFDW